MSSSSLRRKLMKKRPALMVGGGMLVLAMLAGTITTLAFVQANAEAPPVSDKVAQYYSNPPTKPVVELDYVTVIGDSYTGGSDMGGNKDKNWVALVQKSVGAKVSVTNRGIGGSGYSTPGDNFVTRLPMSVGEGTDVVVFFGSRNDIEAAPGVVAGAATAAYTQVRKLAPKAKLLVIGPAWPDRDIPPEIYRLRDEVKTSAAAAKATFVDPLDEGWFMDRPELIGKDGVHPTDEGHAVLAKLIGPRIKAALPAK